MNPTHLGTRFGYQRADNRSALRSIRAEILQRSNAEETPMHRRRLLTAALASVAIGACAPSIEKHQNPASTDYVVFDPATSQIPLPNDLVRAPTTIAAASGAQKEFLQSLAAGFPSDQALSVTIDVQQLTFGGAEPQAAPPPALDLATLTPSTLVVADV